MRKYENVLFRENFETDEKMIALFTNLLFILLILRAQHFAWNEQAEELGENKKWKEYATAYFVLLASAVLLSNITQEKL